MAVQQQQQPQKPSLQQQVDLVVNKINDHAQNLEMGILRSNQQQQIIDQYRVEIYNMQLKMDLLIKMLEEKGTMAKDELNKRWPLFLKNDVGVLEPNGRMEGQMKVSFYDGK